MIETLDDLVEDLADKFGVYGGGTESDEHPDDCKCRICFGIYWRDRIIKAVDIERKLGLLDTERR